jgi:protein SCO1/2
VTIARAALLAALLPVTPLAADTSLQGPLKEVGFDQRLGESAAIDAVFRDEHGKEVSLKSYLGERPVILTLVYYDCPMLCNLTLNGLVAGLKVVDLLPGSDYDVVAVSIDPKEHPGLAGAKKAMLLDRLGNPEAGKSWHLLTGKEPEIKRLADSVGFRYAYDEATKQYAHAAGVVLLTPEGRISKYFYGSDFAPRDLRLGLVDSTNGTIGTAVDQFLLYCFHYDPQTGKYSTAVLNIVRLGGVITLLCLGTFLAVMWRRDRSTRGARS